MTKEDALKADLIAVLRVCRCSHKEADQMATRLVDGIGDVAKEKAEAGDLSHLQKHNHHLLHGF